MLAAFGLGYTDERSKDRDPATGTVTCEEWWREGDEIGPPLAAEPVAQSISVDPLTKR
jgi:hypothetical protein